MLKFAAAAISFMSMFWGAAHAAPGEPDRVIGLLSLPSLFGNGPCDKFEARPLPFFETVDSAAPIGEIRVDAPWTFPDAGGCEGLRVGIHGDGEWAGGEFATMEFAYEAQGAIVLARRGGRYRIELDDSGGAAWVEPAAGMQFYAIEALVSENLAYLGTGGWSGRICGRPGETATCRTINPGSESNPAVTVLGHRRVGGELWFEIKLPVEEGCSDPAPDVPRVQGWVSAYEDGSDEPVIWFYSRGC